MRAETCSYFILIIYIFILHYIIYLYYILLYYIILYLYYYILLYYILLYLYYIIFILCQTINLYILLITENTNYEPKTVAHLYAGLQCIYFGFFIFSSDKTVQI
jgi:hypothetical protein